MCVAGVNVSSIIGMFDVVVVLLVVSASGRESQSSPRILSSKPISSSDRGHAIAAAIDQSEGWLQFLLVALENLFDLWVVPSVLCVCVVCMCSVCSVLCVVCCVLCVACCV